MTIRPLKIIIERQPAALILTSEVGAARAVELGLAGLPAWCVGPRTAGVARAGGLCAIEAGPDAEGLFAAVVAARPQGLLLHLRGEHARGDLAARLQSAGLLAEEIVAYRQEALPPTPAARKALDGVEPLVAPLFSPRSAILLGAWSPRAPLRIVAMSEAVAAEARALRPASLLLAAAPDGPAMVEATLASLAVRDSSAP